MDRVIDRVWLWGQPPGCYHATWKNLPGRSTCTPAEAARALEIDNLILVRFADRPPPPFIQETEEVTFARRIVWSIVGDSSTTSTNDGASDVDAVVALAEQFHTVEGGIMDDLFHPPDERGRFARHSVEAVRGFRKRLGAARRPLDLWCVLYDHNDLPLQPYLDEVDVVAFWTWHAPNLGQLESNLEKAKELCGTEKRMVLGCYLWDFGNDAPIDSPLMAHQLDVALDGLRSGTLEGMVLLGSPVADLPLDSVKCAKEWMQKHGSEKVAPFQTI